MNDVKIMEKDSKVIFSSPDCQPLKSIFWFREAETFDEVQDMILRLEERDDSFHKYEIVRHIRRSLNEAVGAFIEDEIDKQWSASSTSGKEASIESVVEKITEEVVNSNRFSGVENMLRHEISSAVIHSFIVIVAS